MPPKMFYKGDLIVDRNYPGVIFRIEECINFYMRARARPIAGALAEGNITGANGCLTLDYRHLRLASPLELLAMQADSCDE